MPVDVGPVTEAFGPITVASSMFKEVASPLAALPTQLAHRWLTILLEKLRHAEADVGDFVDLVGARVGPIETTHRVTFVSLFRHLNLRSRTQTQKVSNNYAVQRRIQGSVL